MMDDSVRPGGYTANHECLMRVTKSAGYPVVWQTTRSGNPYIFAQRLATSKQTAYFYSVRWKELSEKKNDSSTQDDGQLWIFLWILEVTRRGAPRIR